MIVPLLVTVLSAQAPAQLSSALNASRERKAILARKQLVEPATLHWANFRMLLCCARLVKSERFERAVKHDQCESELKIFPRKNVCTPCTSPTAALFPLIDRAKRALPSAKVAPGICWSMQVLAHSSTLFRPRAVHPPPPSHGASVRKPRLARPSDGGSEETRLDNHRVDESDAQRALRT